MRLLLMTTTHAPTTVLRRLLAAARTAGWAHLTYGTDSDTEHVWRSPRAFQRTAESVAYYHGVLEYRRADAGVCATLRPETADEVAGWLRLLGISADTLPVRCGLCGHDEGIHTSVLGRQVCTECGGYCAPVVLVPAHVEGWPINGRAGK